MIEKLDFEDSILLHFDDACGPVRVFLALSEDQISYAVVSVEFHRLCKLIEGVSDGYVKRLSIEIDNITKVNDKVTLIYI